MKPATQIQSYLELQETVSGKRKTIYDALKVKSMTLFELKEHLGWEINSISGRVTELKNLGIIEETDLKRKNPSSGKFGIVYAVKELNLI